MPSPVPSPVLPPVAAPVAPQDAPEFAPPLAALNGAVPAAPAWFEQALTHAPERAHVNVDGAQIETLAWGRRGDPGLLLLHGNGAHADWYSFIAPLLVGGQNGVQAPGQPGSGAGRRVVAMSFSGMGRSDWRAQYSVAQWAEEALAAAEVTGLFDAATPPVVAAHSFGGFPLMTLAARHGQRLRRAIIMDTPLRAPEELKAREAKRQARAGAADFVAKVHATEALALARFRFLPPQGCEHVFIADHIARHGLTPVVDGAGQPGFSWRFDPTLFQRFAFGKPQLDLGQAKCPVMLVRGGRSRLIPPELLALAVSLAPAGTPTCELPDADHHLMVDQPLAFAAMLARLADEDGMAA